MKRIAYAEEWLTTDDRLADLVLEYARALARQETADTITIPVIEDGSVHEAQFLIGPSSQIIVVDMDEDTPVPFDTREAVAELEERLARLRSPRPVLYDDDEPPRGLPDY